MRTTADAWLLRSLLSFRPLGWFVRLVGSSAWLVRPLGWLSSNGAGTIQERFIRYLADTVAENQLMSLVMSLHWTWGGDSVIMTPYSRVAV